MQDRPLFPENSTAGRNATPLQDLSAALTRSEAAFKIFRDFSVCGLRELAAASLQGLTDSRRLGALDLYDRPVGEVVKELESRQLELEIEIKTAPTACSPANFRNTAWTIERGDSILLLTDGTSSNAFVVGVQKRSNRINPNQ